MVAQEVEPLVSGHHSARTKAGAALWPPNSTGKRFTRGAPTFQARATVLVQ